MNVNYTATPTIEKRIRIVRETAPESPLNNLMTKVAIGTDYRLYDTHNYTRAFGAHDNGLLIMLLDIYVLMLETNQEWKNRATWAVENEEYQALAAVIKEIIRYRGDVWVAVNKYDSGLCVVAPFDEINLASYNYSACAWIISDDLVREFPDALLAKRIEHGMSIISGELDELSAWMRGDCFGFIVEERKVLNLPLPGDTEFERYTTDWSFYDSCYGFYGDDPIKNGMSGYFEQYPGVKVEHDYE